MLEISEVITWNQGAKGKNVWIAFMSWKRLFGRHIRKDGRYILYGSFEKDCLENGSILSSDEIKLRWEKKLAYGGEWKYKLISGEIP